MLIKKIIFLLILGLFNNANYAEILPNASLPARIVEIESFNDFTLYKLEPGGGGCGSGDGVRWRLDMDNTEANKYKRAMLFGAYMAGKIVVLRCELSRVTDFSIKD